MPTRNKPGDNNWGDDVPVEMQSEPAPEQQTTEPARAYGRKTLVGATVVYKGEKQALVKLAGKYGTVAIADLTGDDLTMVDPNTLQELPVIPSPVIEVYPLLWQSGINDPQTATPEQLKTFYRLVLIAAAKAVKG